MRAVLALFPAAAVTLALFWFMHYLISGNRTPTVLPEPAGFVHLVRLERDPDAQPVTPAGHSAPPRSRLPDAPLPAAQALADAVATPDFPALSAVLPALAPPDLALAPALVPPGQTAAAVSPVKTPAASDKAQPDLARAAGVLQAEIRPLTPAAIPGSGTIEMPDGMGDGDEAIPLLRIEPDYPRKAARSGEEGWVRIEFTITEQGTVADPVVVDARPRRVFDRSALAAIRKWQFKPRIDDGTPVSRRATQVIEFRLANR